MKVTTYKVICAWCKLHLHGPEKCDIVSHSICEDCAAQIKAEANRIRATMNEVEA